MIFALSVHNCIPYNDKKNFTFNTHDPVAKLPGQVVISFTVCVISILAGTFICQTLMKTKPFDWFINLLHSSTFSYQEEKSIITAIQSVTIQTYFIDENALQKNNIYFDTVNHTTAHYTAQLLFAICNYNIRFLL